MVMVALPLPLHCVMDVVLVGHAEHFEVSCAEEFAIDRFEEGPAHSPLGFAVYHFEVISAADFVANYFQEDYNILVVVDMVAVHLE